MRTAQEEGRSSQRIQYSRPMQFQKRGTGQVISTISENISVNGVSFLSDSFIPPETAVMLEIGVFSRVVRPIARIVWSQPTPSSNRYRVGAQFMELDPKEKEFLSDYITMRSSSVRRN